MNSITTMPYWKLRRFAARTLAILARHQDTEPVMSAYLQTVGVTATAGIDLYDGSLAHQGTRGFNLTTGKESVHTLRTKMRGWVSMLSANIDSLDSRQYGDNPNVPDDVIADAEQLLAFVTKWEEANGAPLSYTDIMRQDMTEALDLAKAQWGEAGKASANRSGLTEELKKAASAFSRDLVAFRRSLASHIGTSHADYQKLRTSKARTADEDDDIVEDEMPPTDGGDDEDDLDREEVELNADAEAAAE